MRALSSRLRFSISANSSKRFCLSGDINVLCPKGDADECEAGWYCDLLHASGTNVCHRDECITNICSVTCNLSAATDECPRGFSCYDWLSTGQGYCIGDCEWILAKGYL